MKERFNKFNNKLKAYYNNNRYAHILFISYLIISVILSVSLRGVTVGFKYAFGLKPILSDLVFASIIGSFGFLIRNEKKFQYYFIFMLFYSALAIANTIYYVFYSSFLSVNLISTASMIGEVDDSLFEKMHLYQFFYLLGPVIYIFINKYIKKLYIDDKVNDTKKTYFGYTLLASGIVLLILFQTLNGTEISRLVKQWNREYLVQKYGIYVYTINDMIQSTKPKLDTLFGYDEDAREFREYYSCKWENSPVVNNKYTNIFKDKNVIFIHMESIQNFLVDLEINGNEVTPNINRLTKEGIYFSKFYPQISVGTSSDTEFTLSTGLMPSSSGTVFVNYYDREYDSIQKHFNDLGYYTFSMHANNADYWNRKTMHNNLGYQHFYAKDSLEIPEQDSPDFIGLGLSDKSFFRQIEPVLNDIKNNNSKFFGTIITLTNHSPFSELDKYDEFNVNMDYSYVDEDGNYIESTAPYLENTSMGNYITSAHYADAALGEFFDYIRNSSFGDDVVFVLYGDHEARLAKKQFNKLYNYDPINDSIKDKDDESYYILDNYQYDLLKNTPLIIWSKDKEYNLNITDVMGMYDVLPTIGNMFGFTPKYALGNDIFSNNEKIVVFPNGNVLTNKVYYDSSNDEYIVFTNDIIESDYIDRITEYAENILTVSQGIITHDLIKNESGKIGECNEE